MSDKPRIVNVDGFIAAVRASLAPHRLGISEVNSIIVKLVNALPGAS